jgi:hypothetical protein
MEAKLAAQHRSVVDENAALLEDLVALVRELHPIGDQGLDQVYTDLEAFVRKQCAGPPAAPMLGLVSRICPPRREISSPAAFGAGVILFVGHRRPATSLATVVHPAMVHGARPIIAAGSLFTAFGGSSDMRPISDGGRCIGPTFLEASFRLSDLNRRGRAAARHLDPAVRIARRCAVPRCG